MHLDRLSVPRVARCWLFVWLAGSNLTLADQPKRPVDYVDPRIDSAHSRWFFFSSACRPFGMVNLSPDTNTKDWWNSGYCYHAESICGFNHVHAWQLSGPSVMPLTGPVAWAAGSDFCRSNEWLSKIEVEGGTEAQRIKFYTDLWHVLLGRRLTSDVDGNQSCHSTPAAASSRAPR